MKNNRLLLLILTLFFLFNIVYSQPEYPQVSPGAQVSQRIGITDVTVTYHRPGVKGRLVWGGLVPLEKIWRAGANEATTIEFSTDVTIGKTLVPAGKYSIFILPTTKTATIIINKKNDLWGTNGYDENDDIVRLRADLDYLEHQEWLIYTFENLTKNSADLRMRWEDFGIGFTISVETDKFVLEGARKSKGWKELLNAANYCLENNVSLDEGRKWIDESLAEEKNYWNMVVKAKYLANDGQFDGARKIMEDAIKTGKEMDQVPYNVEEMEKLLKEWKNQ